jgi:hypothetical protein
MSPARENEPVECQTRPLGTGIRGNITGGSTMLPADDISPRCAGVQRNFQVDSQPEKMLLSKVPRIYWFSDIMST